MLEDRLDVTEAKSRASTSATFSPRVAASSADPEPTTPPPITTTSNCSLPRRSQAAARCSGPRNEPGRVCSLAGTRIGSLTAQSPVGYSSVGRWPQGYLPWLNRPAPPHRCVPLAAARLGGAPTASSRGGSVHVIVRH